MQPSHMQTERFSDLYRAYFDAVSRYCLRRLPTEDARDATTEVFEVAWRKIGSVTGHDEMLPWLYRVAHNVVRNRSRSSRRYLRLINRVAAQPQTIGRDPVELVVASEPARAVMSALAGLSDADREIIRLRAYEDLSLEQVSLVLQCSVDAAKKRSSRALQRLRAALESNTDSTIPRADRKEGRAS